MPSCKKYPPPQAASSKASDTSTAAGGQPLESFITPIVTAQFEFLELMGQCALAWVNVLPGLAAGKSPEDDIEQQKDFLGNGADNSQAAMTLGASWLPVPTITGLEETLDDEFFTPRPRRTQERDILTLWERSNEFEATHVPANTHASEMHPEPA